MAHPTMLLQRSSQEGVCDHSRATCDNNNFFAQRLNYNYLIIIKYVALGTKYIWTETLTLQKEKFYFDFVHK